MVVISVELNEKGKRETFLLNFIKYHFKYDECISNL